jgi:hypothetical protein
MNWPMLEGTAIASLGWFAGSLFLKIRKGPIIPLDSPCPACGHRDCELAYQADTKKVNRRCKTCGCIVTQPPVAPDLFKDK